MFMNAAAWSAMWFERNPGEDFTLPACEAGMILLRRWAGKDSTVARTLPTVPQAGIGPYAEAFLSHRNTCQECNQSALATRL